MTERRHHTLITPSDALQRLNEPQVTFLDCRWYLNGSDGSEAYRQGHIPGAIFIDLDRHLSDHRRTGEGRHPLPDLKTFVQSLCDLGLDLSDSFIAYDDAGGVVASRFWWMATELGLDCSVLDGGLKAWQGPLTTDIFSRETSQSTAVFPDASFAKGTITISALARGLRSEALILTDARDHTRYRGELEPIDPRPGHIPGAFSLPSSSFLVEPGGLHRPGSELQRTITEMLGSELDESSLVASCGSGVTACHTILVFEHVFNLRPRLFPGSYSQWSQSDELPVAVGATPGRLDP